MWKNRHHVAMEDLSFRPIWFGQDTTNKLDEILFLLPFFTTVDYSTGFIAFTVIIFVRLGANLYVNISKLTSEQFKSFPFRIS